MEKCNECGSPQIKWPIKQQQNKTLKENFDESTINWLNLFKMPVASVVTFLIIILVVYGYTHDVSQCQEVIKDPAGYCENTGCEYPIYYSEPTDYALPEFNQSIS